MVFTISKNVNNSEEKDCMLKRFALSFLVSLPFFTHGVESNNLTIATHSGHFQTPEEVPWTTIALILASIFSVSIQGYCIDKWGRKFGIYIIILLQGATCIPLFLPPSNVGSIVQHVLSGTSSAGLFLVIPIYVREINTDKYRGVMVSLMIIMTSVGYLVRLGLDEEKMLYLIAGMVILQFVTLFLVVESPSYLIKVGKIERAEINMGKLKCLPSDDASTQNAIKLLKEESERAKPNGEFRFFDIVRNLIWRDEMKIGLMLFTINILSGSIIFLDQDKTLMQLRTDMDPQNILVPLCLFVGACFCFVLILFVERKYLLTFAYSVMVLAMGILAVFTQADLTVSSSRWAPITALGVLVFGYGFAWGLPIVIMVEMLNFEIRTTVLSVVYTYSQTLRLAHVVSFQYIEDYVGVYTLLYIFACIDLFGAVYTVAHVPRVQCKSVRQIERQMKRIPLLKL